MGLRRERQEDWSKVTQKVAEFYEKWNSPVVLVTRMNKAVQFCAIPSLQNSLADFAFDTFKKFQVERDPLSDVDSQDFEEEEDSMDAEDMEEDSMDAEDSSHSHNGHTPRNHKDFARSMFPDQKVDPALYGTPGFAEGTLPHGLRLTEEKDGVYTDLHVPQGTTFGPYFGVIVEGHGEIDLGDHQWGVTQGGDLVHYVDSSHPGVSNWMRFIRGTSNEEEQNLAAVQKNSKIYFRAMTDIPAGSELVIVFADRVPPVDLGQFNADFKVKDEKSDGEGPRPEGEGPSPEDDEGYTCIVCYKQFSSASNLARHEKIHGDSRPFECSECPLTFREVSDLRKHTALHSDDRPFTCDYCVATFKQLAGKHRHQLIHLAEKKYPCEECDQKFATVFLLTKHRRQHHPNDLPFRCNFCPSTFAKNSHLVRHERTHTGERPYRCGVCPKTFPDSGTLRTHEAIHTGERRYACRYCPKSFTQSTHRARHEVTHSNPKAYCEICQKHFTGEEALKLHWMNKHYKDGSPATCTQCDLEFESEAQLEKHNCDKHPELVIITCKYCMVQFPNTAQLKEHQKSHSGMMPYECPQCESKFRSRSHLHRHYRVHSGEKPFKCQVCDKSFRDPSTLDKHVNIHTGFKAYMCQFCDKRFNQASNLRTHERNHMGIRPHQCRFCNKTFSQLHVLTYHERTHTGEKPYVCGMCNHAFKCRRTLERHMSKFHAGQEQAEELVQELMMEQQVEMIEVDESGQVLDHVEATVVEESELLEDGNEDVVHILLMHQQ